MKKIFVLNAKLGQLKSDKMLIRNRIVMGHSPETFRFKVSNIPLYLSPKNFKFSGLCLFSNFFTGREIATSSCRLKEKEDAIEST